MGDAIILLVILGSTATMQRFDSMAACKSAADWYTVTAYTEGINARVFTRCTPAGDGPTKAPPAAPAASK